MKRKHGGKKVLFIKSIPEALMTAMEMESRFKGIIENWSKKT